MGLIKGSAFDNLIVSGIELILNPPPQIPGFPIIAIAGGIGIALVVTIVYRRRQSSS